METNQSTKHSFQYWFDLQYLLQGGVQTVRRSLHWHGSSLPDKIMHKEINPFDTSPHRLSKFLKEWIIEMVNLSDARKTPR